MCVLERNDVAGGCIRTSTDLTLPGFTHEVLASWHPLFTGSAAYAELEGELTARGVVYVNTDLPTGTAFPDGSAAFITGSLEGNVAEFDRLAVGDGVAWERQFNDFMGNADLAFGILSTELWSTSGLTLGRKALRRLGRRGLLEFAGKHARHLPRLGVDDVRVRGRARRARAVGAAHRPRARSGDVRVHDAGDRCSAATRRHAGTRRRRRSPRRRADGDRHRCGRRGAALGRCAADPRRQRPRDRCAPDRRRGRRRRHGRSSRT